MGVGVVSLVYARTQAVHVRRQADAAHLSGTLAVQRDMTDRVTQARLDMIGDANFMAQYLEANPGLHEVFHDQAMLRTATVMRNLIDGFQDIYFLRKRGIVEDHHWRNWSTAFVPLAHIATMRVVYDNAVRRGAIDPEFARFMEPLFDDRPLADPKSS